MKPNDVRTSKKTYRAPEVVVHGDLRRLTAGAAGGFRDGGPTAAKSKANGQA